MGNYMRAVQGEILSQQPERKSKQLIMLQLTGIRIRLRSRLTERTRLRIVLVLKGLVLVQVGARVARNSWGPGLLS